MIADLQTKRKRYHGDKVIFQSFYLQDGSKNHRNGTKLPHCHPMNHKPGGRLPLLSARPAVIPATLKRAATSFAAW